MITDKDVGKICVFWDSSEDSMENIGILTCLSICYYTEDNKLHKKIRYERGTESWKHCRRLTEKEIKEMC
jgi:hypothetical protein